MRYYEVPPQERKKLISPEKARSWKYVMVKIGFFFGVLGTVAFFLSFFYQNSLNDAGLPYRQAELYAIIIVFIGWVTFIAFARWLGISTRILTYSKLMSILKNEVETALDEHQAIRKQVAAALGCLDDNWALYPAVFADDTRKIIPMVIIGPGGVFGVHVSTRDARKRDFIDPSPTLISGCEELGKKLKKPVKPIMVFMRKAKNYQSPNPELNTFAIHEFVAYLSAREDIYSPNEVNGLEANIRYIANLDTLIHKESRFGNHSVTRTV